MRNFLSILFASAAVLGVGCGFSETSHHDKIANRHGIEFGCDPTTVTVQTVDFDWGHSRGTFAATGCGVRAMYVCESQTCVRNGEATQVASMMPTVPTSGK